MRATPLKAPSLREALAPPEVRLSLLEVLIRSDEPAVCAQLCLEWLRQQAGMEKGLCALAEEDTGRLVAVGAVGVPLPQSEDGWVDLEGRAHPLVAALRSEGAIRLRAEERHPLSGLGGPATFAVPLGRHSPDHPALGVLVVSGAALIASPNVQWIVEVLSDRLVAHRTRQSSAGGRFGRERALLHGVINAVTDPILLTDPEGKLLIANSRAEHLFIAREDESEGKRRAVALNNMLFSAALAGREMEADGEGPRTELLLADPTDGSDLLFELLAQQVKEPGGGVGIVSVLRNVTDLGRATAEIGENYQKLRHAEAQVLSERHRLDVIIDSVADPIVVTDDAGELVLMNRPAERLFTLRANDPGEVQRRVRNNDAHFSSFISSLLFTAHEARVRHELDLVDPTDGTPRPVEAVAGRIFSERGQLATVVTILHDRREAIERARLFEQLKAASGELEARVQAATAELAQQNELLRRQAIALEQASAAKSQFLANMSHELRTPLNAILGYTAMVLQGVSGRLSPPQTRSLTRIDSNARHLLEIINEILDITRIESGRMPLHLTRFCLRELLDEVQAELDPIIQRSHLAVLTEVGREVPEVVCDRQKVKQIVVNLLSNALKFTHRGQVRVKVGYARAERQVRVEVRDTGIGIAPEHHDRIFENFRQVDSSTTRAYGGTGLGLSICQRLARMLDGRITVRSRLGEGSTFTLTFPVRQRRK